MLRRFTPAHLVVLFIALLVASGSVLARTALEPSAEMAASPDAVVAPRSSPSLVEPAAGFFQPILPGSAYRPRSVEPGTTHAASIPPSVPEVPDGVREEFGRGYALLRVGDYLGADAAFSAYTEHDDAIVASEALFRRGQVAVLDDRHAEAVEILSELRLRYPSSPAAAEGAVLLGTALRAQGDCVAAIVAYGAAAQERPLLAAHAHSLRAGCLIELGRTAEAIDAQQAVLATNPPRLLRLEALERQAEAHRASGNYDAALDVYGTLLGESRARGYTAELLFQAAGVNRDLGNADRAVERLTQIVIDYAQTPTASAALDVLNVMNASDHISWHQAGLVRMHQRHLSQAIAAFDQELATHPDGTEAAEATFYRGVSKIRIDATDDGIADLLRVVDHWPQDPLAPQALLQAGIAHETLDRWDSAADTFDRLITRYPGAAAAAEGRFQFGFVRYAADDHSAAAAAWSKGLDIDASPDLRARLLLWRGKALTQMGDGPGADADWNAARDAAPESFAGLRARDLLAGNEAGRAWQAATFPAPLDQGVDAWLIALGEDPSTVEASVAGEARFQRADALLQLAQRTRAYWEIDDLVEAYFGQPGKLFVLARLLDSRGAYDLSFKAAQAALAVRPQEALLAAPAALQRLAYPIAYADLLEWQRLEQGVDPMLMLALMRQESSFNPGATSSADARGLTQVLPATGELLAQQLGYERFDADDLYKPVVSVQFGATFLNETLGRYNGRVYPALAAYNAGPGASDDWLATYGNDMDVWAERIPYPETYGYVQKVFTFYGRYRLVYGLAQG